ncbi:putative lipoprotein lprH [Mycobacterium xenopi 3993]|nr:putative lipoprotein lprH [Mycobacterium xenopi 3993]
MPETLPALAYEHHDKIGRATGDTDDRACRLHDIGVRTRGFAAGRPGTVVVSRSGRSPKAKPPPIFARDLLLHDGDSSPFGPAAMTDVGDTYFTSVRPPECSAALLFKGSPLRPPHSTDYADSAYSFGGSAMYSESVDVYDKALDVHAVVWDGYGAVSRCTAEAVGIAPRARSRG